MQVRRFSAFWNEDGTISDNVPEWIKKRDRLRDMAFPSPYTDQPDRLADSMEQAIKVLNALKPDKQGWGCLGDEPTDSGGPDYGRAKAAKIAAQSAPLEEVIQQSADMFKGLPNWNHPLVMPNVLPPANIASIAASFMTDMFSPNLIEGEYSWNVHFSELESAAMLADLIGWDPVKAGGLFTFGGAGCYFYGLKYALTSVLGVQSRHKGIRTDGKVLVSQQGHYCKLNSTDWSGLGMDNIIDIETDDRNSMDLNHLEAVMARLHSEGTPVIAVMCTMGTTDAFGMDPVAQVRKLIDKYPNPPGYGRPFLYCDAVIGWSWLMFRDYDFSENPLGFSAKVLPIIRKNYEAVMDMRHADAVGCDFHKVGWTPYNCSIFVFQDNADFQRLMLRPGADYLQERTEYNPGLYTFEVSRSASYSMAAWATLKFLGQEGFQVMLGGILEVQQHLRNLLKKERTMVCVNEDDYGFVTLFRVYPKGVDAEMQYRLERTCPDFRKDLERHNILQQAVADKLWEWSRGKHPEGVDEQQCSLPAPYISYTSGFRPTAYNQKRKDPRAVIYALKSFPMNLNISAESMSIMIKLVQEARDQIAEQGCG